MHPNEENASHRTDGDRRELPDVRSTESIALVSSEVDSDQSGSPKPEGSLPRIPGYELLGKLGMGGMGIVYEARHLALNRRVAIKIINRIQQASEREVVRLQMEGETVANLQHPNIVQLYQLGEFGGLPFLAFEFVDGGNLAERIAGRPQPSKYAAELMETVGRAVQVAHQQGVLHRDLKPANVLLTGEGVPKIADFGLARRLDHQEYSTELLAGTACYMSPEQAWGGSKSNPLTPAADIYSLGAIFYDLLTGRPPFASDSVEKTIQEVWHKTPADPRILAPDVPRDLATICLKCLEKEPGRRYASAAEFADDLRRYLDNEPIAARPTGRFERVTLWCRREPWFAGLSLGLVLAIAIGIAGISWLALIYRDKSNDAEAAAQLAVANATTAQSHAARAALNEAQVTQANKTLQQRQEELSAANNKLEQRLYEAVMLTTAHDVELMNRDPHGTLCARLAWHLSQCSPRLRDLEWHIRNRQMQGSLLTRPVTRNNLFAMALSHDGAWLATGAVNPAGSTDGEPVRVWSTHDWQLRASLGHDGQRLVFSPDDQWIVIDNALKGVEIWNWREGRLIRTFERKSKPVQRNLIDGVQFQPVEGVIAFGADGRQMAIGLDGAVQLYRLDDNGFPLGEPERRLATGPVLSVAFNPRDSLLQVLVFVPAADELGRKWQAELQSWNTATVEIVRKRPMAGPFRLMCLRDDGRLCIVMSVRTPGMYGPLELQCFDLVDGSTRTAPYEADPQSIRFSRDGQTLFVANDRGEIDLIDVQSLELKTSLVGHLGIGGIAVDSLPDGQIVSAGADGTVKLWPMDGKSRLPRWVDGNLPFALSPDGRELSVAQADGTVRRLDLDQGRSVPSLRAQPIEIRPQGDPATAGDHSMLGIAGLCYTRSGGKLLVAYSDLSVRTWELQDGTVTSSVQLMGPGLTRPNPGLAQASGYFVASSPEPRIFFSGDGLYAGWPGTGQGRDPYYPSTTSLMVWEVASGRTIVNEQSRFFMHALGPEHRFEFATSENRVWAVFRQKFPTVDVPGRPYDAGDFVTGWDLTTGEQRLNEQLPRELRYVRGTRSITAVDALTISDPATGTELLRLPLGATGLELPRLSDNRSRLAVATDKGIAVFDIAPLPEFSLPDTAVSPP